MQAVYVAPPHPDWKAGDKQPIPYEGKYITVNTLERGAAANYPLVISSITPRPIGFLGTLSAEGKRNLSPYSYFGAMGHDPPLVRIFPTKWAFVAPTSS